MKDSQLTRRRMLQRAGGFITVAAFPSAAVSASTSTLGPGAQEGQKTTAADITEIGRAHV